MSDYILYTPSDFVEAANQTFEYAYPLVIIEGEVESFKVNRNQYVFFNLKDDEASVSCFMMKFNLHMPIEDGMTIRARARPKLTKWGKFSLTVDSLAPIGEGNIKKAFDKLKQQLEKEGLFDESHKQQIPHNPKKVAVIASTESAGYIDFMKIASDLTGGVQFSVYNSLMQGFSAADSIVKKMQQANQDSKNGADYDALVLIRGGGSADDLSVFNDERVVRAIFESKVPIVTGIGHEIDVTLADLVADLRSATPTHVATTLFSDKKDKTEKVEILVYEIRQKILNIISETEQKICQTADKIENLISEKIDNQLNQIENACKILHLYNPETDLKRGYSIIQGEIKQDNLIEIMTDQYKIKARIENYEKRID